VEKDEHKKRMQVAVNKLVASFEKKNITFDFTDPLGNVTITSPDKQIKISDHSFYRYSGICNKYSEDDKKNLVVTEITDEMYLNIIIKPVIELLLK